MLFGSSENEFGSLNSDIDISMKLPGNFEASCLSSNTKILVATKFLIVQSLMIDDCTIREFNFSVGLC